MRQTQWELHTWVAASARGSAPKQLACDAAASIPMPPCSAVVYTAVSCTPHAARRTSSPVPGPNRVTCEHEGGESREA